MRTILTCALSFCLLCSTQSHAAIIVADSQAEFSSTQGENGWYYGYVGVATSPAFIQFPAFYSAWAWGTPALPAWAIDDPTPGGTCNFSAVWDRGGHTNGVVTSGARPAEHWSVRRWISDVAGPLHVSGIVGDRSWSPTSNPDGVDIEILVDQKIAYSEITNGTVADHPYSFDTTVSVGSIVDFVVKPRTSDYADHHTLTAVMTVPEPAASLIIAAAGLVFGGCRIRNRPLNGSTSLPRLPRYR